MNCESNSMHIFLIGLINLCFTIIAMEADSNVPKNEMI